MRLKFVIDKKYDLEMASNKKEAEERYKGITSYLKETKVLYQKSWDKINDEFFKCVEEITGYPWKHKIYFCVVSPFHTGISSWGGNKIIRGWRENPYTMRKITAHELIISHLFSIFEKDFKNENLSDKEKWALAEISAWAITGLEKKMLKFWPWISEKEKYPLNHNYPTLYQLQKLLRTKYEKKRTFKEFLKEAIRVIKEKNKKIKLHPLRISIK